VRQTYIVGVGMSPFGRFPETPLGDLAARAAAETLADANAAPGEVEAIVFANATQGALDGQHGIRGQAALDGAGFGNAPVFNVENACASASTALNLAHVLVGSETHDCVLAIGAEKMVMPDAAKSMAAFEGSWDLSRRQQTIDKLLAMGSGMAPPAGTEANEPHSVFMDVYAAFCRHHMAKFGTTQRQMAAVSAKNHQHSVHNPRSQYRRSFSIEEVLAARPIVWPLTLPMCSPISDGAAAALVCSHQFAERLSVLSRAVRIRASVLISWKATSLARRPGGPMTPLAWVQTTSMSSNVTMRPRSAKSSRASCLDFSSSAPEARRPRVAIQGSEDAFRLIRRAVSSLKVTPSAPLA
jgi:acetyl-CoA acyltransferase